MSARVAAVSAIAFSSIALVAVCLFVPSLYFKINSITQAVDEVSRTNSAQCFGHSKIPFHSQSQISELLNSRTWKSFTICKTVSGAECTETEWEAHLFHLSEELVRLVIRFLRPNRMIFIHSKGIKYNIRNNSDSSARPMRMQRQQRMPAWRARSTWWVFCYFPTNGSFPTYR